MSQGAGDAQLPARVDREKALAVEQNHRALALLEEQDTLASGLHNYANLFLRRKMTILVILVGVLAMSILATALTPRTYEATAVLLVSEPEKNSSSNSDATANLVTTAMGSPNLDTHVQLLMGEEMAEATSRWLSKYSGPPLTPEAVRGRLRIKAVRDTQLIRISAVAGSADDAMRIANAAANAYVSENRRRAQKGSESTGNILNQQLYMAKQELTKATGRVRAFQEATGTVTPDASASDLVGRVATLQGEYDTVGADLAQAQQRLTKISSQLAKINGTIQAGQVRNDTVIQQLRTELANLKSQQLAAKEKYTEAYPEPLAKINEQIRIKEQQLNEEIRHIVRGSSGDLTLQQALISEQNRAQADTAALNARRQQVQVELDEAKSHLNKIPGRQLTLASLQRDLDVAESVYTDLLKKTQQVEVGRVMALGNADIAEQATKPHLPVKPNVMLNLMLGLLLGLGIGLGVAVLQDQLDDSVRDQKEAGQLASAPILGTIPVFDRPEMPMLAPVNGAHSTALEAYRALRYCLDFITPGERGKTVLVTSAGPSEGKTTTVLNLAMAVALTGRRVVLIDTDLRRSGLRRMLEVEETKGVTDVLLGEVELHDVLQHNAQTGGMFISSGKQVPNATELLESKAMRDMLEELRNETDLIILDSPPVLSVADTLVLASLADTVLMVCVAGQSHRYDVQLARQLLSHVGERISGVVLNKVGHKAGYAYHNRYYYY